MAVKCALLIPVRSFADAKTRLSNILDPTQREKAMRGFVSTVVTAGLASLNVIDIILVSGDDAVEEFAQLHSPPIHFFRSDATLNTALKSCVDQLDDSVDTIIIAHGDLAWITSFDDIIDCLTIDRVVLAPDRHRLGTNIYAHRKDVNVTYFFGEGSFTRHINSIESRGLSYYVIQSQEFSFDVDTEEDFVMYQSIKT